MTKWHWSQVSSSTMEGLISIKKNYIFSKVLSQTMFLFYFKLDFGVLSGSYFFLKNHE